MTGSRLVPSPALAAALDAYGRAFANTCRTSHPHFAEALADAEQALLRVIEAGPDGLTSNDTCLCGGRGYHASPDEGDPVDVYCSCPAGVARERADNRERARVANDDGPREHIPRGLLDGAGG